MVARSHTHRHSLLPAYEVGMLSFSRLFSHKYDWPLQTVVLSPSLNLNQQQTVLPACEPHNGPLPRVRACFSCPSKTLGEPDLSKALRDEHTGGRALLSPHLPPCSSEEEGTREDPLSDHQCVYFNSPSTQDASLEEGADKPAERAEKEQQQKQHVVDWRGGPAITRQEQLGTSLLSSPLLFIIWKHPS